MPSDVCPVHSVIHSASLPAHIAAVTRNATHVVGAQPGLLCEFVLDVSEIERRPLLAIVGLGVPLHSPARMSLHKVSVVYKLPLITAKPGTP
jgi:hypothetical protein